MSREGSVSRDPLPQQWNVADSIRVWRNSSRFDLSLLRNNSRWLVLTLLPVAFGTLGFLEVRTSEAQARILSAIAARVSFNVGSGPSPRIAFPSGGPFNLRRGYARIPEFERGSPLIGPRERLDGADQDVPVGAEAVGIGPRSLLLDWNCQLRLKRSDVDPVSLARSGRDAHEEAGYRGFRAGATQREPHARSAPAPRGRCDR